MGDFIPVNEPLLNGNEKKYLEECIDTGWISSEGPFVQQFEERMSTAVDRKYGIAVCNGTAALEIAVAALELQPGDEIILPAFTIISCAAAIIRRGCVPVLVDSDPITWNMDASLINTKITAKTKAIMIVHIYGLPVDINPVLELASKYNLKIIEDAAEMHGQTYKGKPCGSFGNISIFSFYSNKHITTGEGGMLLTDDEYLAERCRSLRNLCFKPEKRFVHDELGYNFRMTNLQAALGLAQLERLEEFVARKRLMGKLYTEMLSSIPDLELPLPHVDYSDNIYWVYGMVLKESVTFDAEEMIRRLTKQNIGTRPFFLPMHKQPVFCKMKLFQNESYPVAERLAQRGFYVPSGLALTEVQLKQVVKAIRFSLNLI
jgi:perosamine synthetase